MVWLGVDMGGSATRWVACDCAGIVVAQGQTPGATGLMFDAPARARIHAALAPIRAALPDLRGAYLGMTGAGFDDDPDLRCVVAQALDLPEPRVRIVNDMVLTHRALFPQGGGHLVAAGTGSVGFSMNGAAIVLIGGRGTLIDDGGSGAWIALRALDQVWRLIDAHGTPKGAEGLAEALFAAIGGSDWEATRRFVYGNGRGEIGTLARAVSAAAQAGDAVALDLMTRAGEELARLARALVARAGAAPVAVIGGVLDLHPAIRATLLAATPGLSLTFPQPDPARCAAGLAHTLMETA